jgi:hypothetical protein
MAGDYYDRRGKRISAELAGCLFQKPGYRDIATCQVEEWCKSSWCFA